MNKMIMNSKTKFTTRLMAKNMLKPFKSTSSNKITLSSLTILADLPMIFLSMIIESQLVALLKTIRVKLMIMLMSTWFIQLQIIKSL